MKKSFMTRALAMGLSLAMAFSMSAATNVTTAAAAAKPAMKNSKMTVKVGQTKKYSATAATQKAYKIVAIKTSAKGKTQADVTIASNKKSISVTGKAATKGMNVKITFKNNKTKAKTTVTSKLVVKAVEEKLAMTAEAAAVKEIKLTFNKAVDKATAKVVVKKANATPTFTATWADDAKSATLAMDSKLTKGVYDITVTTDKEEATASVTVEDQKLTTFKLLSNNLVANNIPVSFGSIRIQGIDQYGNAMKVDKVTITSSFGQFGSLNTAGTTFTAAAAGSTVTIKDSEPYTATFQVTPALAILGTKGTITIVEGNTGVNLSEEITLVSPAKASKLENLGLYNVNKGKFMNMTAGDKITDYAIALKLSDQYDVACNANAVKTSGEIQTTVAGGVTNVNTTVTEDVIKIGDDDVYVLKLTGVNGNEVKAGTMQVTVVNNKVGLLGNLSFEVAPGTVVKSFSVTADNDLFANEDNTLSYSALDADGNSVTKYDVLSKAITTKPAGVTIKKQADGTAKFVYNTSITNNGNTTDYKASDVKALTFMLYEGTANIIVYNTNVTVHQKRIICEVNGIDSSKVTATTTGASLKYKLTDFKIADQYGNTLSKDQIKDAMSATSYVVATVVTGSTGWTVTGSAVGVSVNITSATDDIVITPGAVAAGKVNFKAAVQGNYKDDGFDLALSVVDSAKAADFAIEWLKDGLNTFCVSDAALNLSAGTDFQVVAMAAGKKVVVPTSQYVIVGGGHQDQVKQDPSKDKITKEGTLSVSVDDEDHNSNVITATYTYSNENPKLTVLKAKDGTAAITSNGSVTMAGIVATTTAAFELKDQYGQVIAAPGDMTATVSITGDGNKGTIKYNNTNSVEVTPVAGEPLSEITVELVYGTLKATKTINVN